ERCPIDRARLRRRRDRLRLASRSRSGVSGRPGSRNPELISRFVELLVAAEVTLGAGQRAIGFFELSGVDERENLRCRVVQLTTPALLGRRLFFTLARLGFERLSSSLLGLKNGFQESGRGRLPWLAGQHFIDGRKGVAESLFCVCRWGALEPIGDPLFAGASRRFLPRQLGGALLRKTCRLRFDLRKC